YTSGSTGKPKGIAVGQQSVVNLLAGLKRTQQIQEGWKFVFNGSISFDAAVKQIFLPLAVGSSLHLTEAVSNAKTLVNYLKKEEINVLHATPMFWGEIVREMREQGPVKTLRVASAGGDQLTKDLVDALLEVTQEQDCALFNTYGPTEICVNALCYPVSGPVPELPPIGKPLPNYASYVLDGQLQPVPIGVTGELCIGGAGLARGYLNQVELTADKFVENPYNPGGRLYRTGDLARWLPDGNLEFLGRKDRQVKLRGYRIELGEIENRLQQHPAIDKAAVVVHQQQGDPPQSRLTAYYTASAELGPDEIINFLGNKLPLYMMPSCFVPLARFPLTTSGKIDLRALPLPPAEARKEEELNFVNDSEKAILQIVKEILESDKIGVDENIFNAGGNSMGIIRIYKRINELYPCAIEPYHIFANPSARKIAVLIRQAADTPQTKTVTDVEL
ncbi:MAG: non-ribosomal peptide synthetase, partial [Cytophagales bacterium]|nr:non-ribosomal peptide synthetase [Cytophagales bacterium]